MDVSRTSSESNLGDPIGSGNVARQNLRDFGHFSKDGIMETEHPLASRVFVQ